MPKFSNRIIRVKFIGFKKPTKGSPESDVAFHNEFVSDSRNVDPHSPALHSDAEKLGHRLNPDDVRGVLEVIHGAHNSERYRKGFDAVAISEDLHRVKQEIRFIQQNTNAEFKRKLGDRLIFQAGKAEIIAEYILERSNSEPVIIVRRNNSETSIPWREIPDTFKSQGIGKRIDSFFIKRRNLDNGYFSAHAELRKRHNPNSPEFKTAESALIQEYRENKNRIKG